MASGGESEGLEEEGRDERPGPEMFAGGGGSKPSGGSKGGIKLGGLKDPYCRFYHIGAYFLYPTYLHITFFGP